MECHLDQLNRTGARSEWKEVRSELQKNGKIYKFYLSYGKEKRFFNIPNPIYSKNIKSL